MDVNQRGSRLKDLMRRFDLLGRRDRDGRIILLARNGSGNCDCNDHRLHMISSCLSTSFLNLSNALFTAKFNSQPWTTALEANGSKAGAPADRTEAIASAATIAAPPMAMNIAVGPV